MDLYVEEVPVYGCVVLVVVVEQILVLLVVVPEQKQTVLKLPQLLLRVLLLGLVDDLLLVLNEVVYGWIVESVGVLQRNRLDEAPLYLV